MQLYGAPQSPFVRKVRIVLEEKGLPYQLEGPNLEEYADTQMSEGMGAIVLERIEKPQHAAPRASGRRHRGPAPSRCVPSGAPGADERWRPRVPVEPEASREALGAIVRDEVGLVLASLIASFGDFALQDAVAAAHALAPSGAETPWSSIAALYAELESLTPSPVGRVNRAVAEGRARGPEAGLVLLAALEGEDASFLADYLPYHAARADLLRRAGRRAEAAAAYRRALVLCPSQPERRFLAGRLAGLAQ
jgi:hypothetical protein